MAKDERGLREAREEKWALREEVWGRLTREKLAAFPLPVRGRIPNFKGSSAAAAILAGQPEFRSARLVKVNPDSPQRPIRQAVLDSGKTLLVATPRLREGFLRIEGVGLSSAERRQAATIDGAARFGTPIGLDQLPRPDLIVVGTVAVAPSGARVGKGEGYAELEYATLRQLGLIDEGVPLATTVHDTQVVDSIPVEPFDVPIDLIVTPTRVIRTASTLPKPSGILWEYLAEERLELMPILKELRDRG
jgi:5-formyltetrahydrofolate cyclo-ligase